MGEPSPNQLSDFLEAARSAGAVESDGVFTLDPAEARRKIAQFQLLPGSYVLSLFAAAYLGGARNFEFSSEEGPLFVWDGPSPSRRELDNLLGFAFSRKQPHLRELALAMVSALHRANEVQLTVRGKEADFELVLREGVEELNVRGASEPKGQSRFVVRLRTTAKSSWTRRTTLDLEVEEQMLRERCLTDRTQLLIRGEMQNLRIDLGEPLLLFTLQGHRVPPAPMTASLHRTVVWEQEFSAHLALGGTAAGAASVQADVNGVLYTLEGSFAHPDLRVALYGDLPVDLSRQHLTTGPHWEALVARIELELQNQLWETFQRCRSQHRRKWAILASHFLVLADQLEETGELEKALSVLLLLDRPFAWVRSLRLATRLGQLELAAEIYHKLEESYDLEVEVPCWLAELGGQEQAAGNPKEAFKWYRRSALTFLRSEAELETARQLSQKMLAFGMLDEAEKVLGAALSKAVLGQVVREELDEADDSIPETWPLWIQNLQQKEADFGHLAPIFAHYISLAQQRGRVLPGIFDIYRRVAEAEGRPTPELLAQDRALMVRRHVWELEFHLDRLEWFNFPDPFRRAGSYLENLEKLIPETPLKKCLRFLSMVPEPDYLSSASLQGLVARICRRAWSLRRSGALPNHFWPWIEDGYGHFFEKAIAEMKRCERSEPAILLELGELHLDHDQVEKAARFFQQARELELDLFERARLEVNAVLLLLAREKQPAAMRTLPLAIDLLEQLTGYNPLELTHREERLRAGSVLDRRPHPKWTNDTLALRLNYLARKLSPQASRVIGRYALAVMEIVHGSDYCPGSAIAQQLRWLEVLGRR